MGTTGVTRRRKRRVAVVTGTRAEYGLLRSTIAALRQHPRTELLLVVTGMHLLRAFGRTVRQIVADGFPIAARVPMQRGDDSPDDQGFGLARGVAGLTRFMNRARPDIVLVLGDRIEALAAALAATATGRILAHLHGGDVAPGDFDGPVRDAITKLAHLHLPATRAAATRIRRMGEKASRIRVVGPPGLDEIRETRARLAANRHVRNRGDAPRSALVVQHAYGRAAPIERAVATAVLEEVAAAGLRRVVILPNSDRGNAGVRAAIRSHRRANPGEVDVFESLPRGEYLQRLAGASLLIGNSSSGLLEAPAIGTPSVNVGARQRGRDAYGTGVFHCDESPRAIRNALCRALRSRAGTGRGDRARRASPPRGGVGRRVAEILSNIAITSALRSK